MPYKDPARQREYLRTWRRNQKLRASRAPAQHIVRKSLAREWNMPPLPAAFPAAPTVDQTTLKMSPDGAPQTGREATLAYQMNRGRPTAPRTNPMSTQRPQAPVVLPKTRSRHIAMPIAALVVELVSKAFS
jgi:hypothetical protein